MDKIDRKQIMETFIRMIDHVSNKEYQKRAWIKGEEADFDEAVCIFFGVGDPILENYKDFGITKAQYKLLKKLRDEFRIFADENDLPEEFIDTPEWSKIMDLAKDVLKFMKSQACTFNYKSKKTTKEICRNSTREQ